MMNRDDFKFLVWNGNEFENGEEIFLDYEACDEVRIMVNGYYLNRVGVIRFTGKQDFEGKDIYEDFIVRLDTFRNSEESRLFFVVKKGNDGKWILCRSLYEDRNLSEYVNNCTIIGNRFENPELYNEIVNINEMIE
jgi:hypothetical protein